MRFARFWMLFLQSFFLVSCATVRPGNDGFRVITMAYESQLSGEAISETMRRADTEAQRRMGVYIKDHEVDRKKFAGLLGLSFDHPDVIMYAGHAPTLKPKSKMIAGERVVYSFAALPLAAPNAFVSGGLSVLFPGLGQIYQKRGGLGHMALGALSIGATFYNFTQYDQWHGKYQRETRLELINEYYDKSNTWYRYTRISLAAYGIVTIFSAIDAFTLAQSNQMLLDDLRRGGIRTSDNVRLMIHPMPGQLLISLSYGL